MVNMPKSIAIMTIDMRAVRVDMMINTAVAVDIVMINTKMNIKRGRIAERDTEKKEREETTEIEIETENAILRINTRETHDQTIKNRINQKILPSKKKTTQKVKARVKKVKKTKKKKSPMNRQ